MTPKPNPRPEPDEGCLADDLDEDFLPLELSPPTPRNAPHPGPSALLAADRIHRISTQPPPFLAQGYK